VNDPIPIIFNWDWEQRIFGSIAFYPEYGVLRVENTCFWNNNFGISIR
jgi:hypothetical protein